MTVSVGDLVFALEYEPSNCDYMYGEGHHISLFFRCFADSDVTPLKASIPDVNPDDATIISAAKWIPISDLGKVNLIPNISKPLIKYIETGIFTPFFWAEDEQLHD